MHRPAPSTQQFPVLGGACACACAPAPTVVANRQCCQHKQLWQLAAGTLDTGGPLTARTGRWLLAAGCFVDCVALSAGERHSQPPPHARWVGFTAGFARRAPSHPSSYHMWHSHGSWRSRTWYIAHTRTHAHLLRLLPMQKCHCHWVLGVQPRRRRPVIARPKTEQPIPPDRPALPDEKIPTRHTVRPTRPTRPRLTVCWRRGSGPPLPANAQRRRREAPSKNTCTGVRRWRMRRISFPLLPIPSPPSPCSPSPPLFPPPPPQSCPPGHAIPKGQSSATWHCSPPPLLAGMLIVHGPDKSRSAEIRPDQPRSVWQSRWRQGSVPRAPRGGPQPEGRERRLGTQL